MKNVIFRPAHLLAAIILVIITSCSEKKPEHGLIIPKEKPAQALTIGWYVPVAALKEIVGANFEPAVVKDDSIGTIMIYIVANGDHKVDSLECGTMKAAHLVIPVNKPANLKFANASSITNSMVCPTSIVEQSPVLGNKYHSFGFPTYTGKINLDVSLSGKLYHVKASVETANGLIEIAAQFEEEPVEYDIVSAIFNPKSSSYDFMYGKENFHQIINGKGNLKTDGNNMIKALNLSGMPYYLKIDLGINWTFDFEKE